LISQVSKIKTQQELRNH